MCENDSVQGDCTPWLRYSSGACFVLVVVHLFDMSAKCIVVCKPLLANRAVPFHFAGVDFLVDAKTEFAHGCHATHFTLESVIGFVHT